MSDALIRAEEEAFERYRVAMARVFDVLDEMIAGGVLIPDAVLPIIADLHVQYQRVCDERERGH